MILAEKEQWHRNRDCSSRSTQICPTDFWQDQFCEGKIIFQKMVLEQLDIQVEGGKNFDQTLIPYTKD